MNKEIKNQRDKINKLIDETHEYLIISSERGFIAIGSVPEILTLLIDIVGKLSHEIKVPKNVLKEAFELGLLNEKEKNKKAKEKIKIMNKILEALGELYE